MGRFLCDNVEIGIENQIAIAIAIKQSLIFKIQGLFNMTNYIYLIFYANLVICT